jgi:hypothetical protein
LGEALKAKDFLDVVSLDIVGPLPFTERGNKYLLSFVDHFTRYCDAIPIAKQDTETIARVFVLRIITQLGVPRKLLTDRGANFTSALIEKTCKLLGIQKLQTSSYNPQANGICERAHKLLIDMISHYVRKDAKNWDEYVPYAVMAYRAMPHCATTYSPYYLVFGREMRLPVEDDWKPRIPNREITGDEYEEYVKKLAERLKEASKVAGGQSKLSHETAKRYYDRRTKLEQFSKGTLVYVYDPTYKRGKAKKFSYQYKGPYEVERKISPLIYKIRLADGTSTIVHVNRLKKAYEKETDGLQLPVGKYRGQATQPVPVNRPLLGETDDFPETFERDIDIPPYPQKVENACENVSEAEDEENSSLSPGSDDEPNWTPESRYMRRKLHSNKEPTDVAYRLRSRLVSRSEQEPELDKRETENSNQSADGVTQTTERPVSSHSYNLRERK